MPKNSLTKFRFLACGVYRVSFDVLTSTRLCGTIILLHEIETFRSKFSVIIANSIVYFFTIHKHYKISTLCKHGVSSICFAKQQLVVGSRYYNKIFSNYSLLVFAKSRSYCYFTSSNMTIISCSINSNSVTRTSLCSDCATSIFSIFNF